MSGRVSPSMMCIPIEQTTTYLRLFEEMSVEYLHVDVMDGCFVPNYTLGTDYIKQLRRLSKIPLDVHLMIGHPEDKIDWFDFQPGELVSIHAESTKHLQRNLQKVQATGAAPLVALNPATPVCNLDYVLDDISGVLVMTVNPGFAGQHAVEAAIDKIADVKGYLREKHRENLFIEVDGNVSFEHAPRMRQNGADIFVLGTSSVLSPKVEPSTAMQRFRTLISK